MDGHSRTMKGGLAALPESPEAKGAVPGQGIRLSRRPVAKALAIILAGFFLFFLACNDYGIYRSSIAKISSIDETFLYTKNGSLGNHEDYYKQAITAVIKNGENKGKTVFLENTYGSSLVYDDKYALGNSIFIEQLQETPEGLTASITGMKRDYFAAGTMIALAVLLLIVGGRQGLFTILCLCINIILFFALLVLNRDGFSILPLSIVMSVLFSAAVLFLINGRGRNTLIALCATLSSVAFVTILSFIVITFSNDIEYEFMEYLAQPYERADADMLFLSEILMGGLGVIIDISVSITACASELIRQNPSIERKPLLKSCREVSDDITGTMINVVFFTNVSACIPLFIVSMQNGIEFLTVIRYGIFFETARFLAGSIGIIAAIPLSILAALLFHRKGDETC